MLIKPHANQQHSQRKTNNPSQTTSKVCYGKNNSGSDIKAGYMGMTPTGLMQTLK